MGISEVSSRFLKESSKGLGSRSKDRRGGGGGGGSIGVEIEIELEFNERDEARSDAEVAAEVAVDKGEERTALPASLSLVASEEAFMAES